MLVNYGFGHAPYSVVPYHPDTMWDRWAVMWGPSTPFNLANVFTDKAKAEAFAAEQRAIEAASGGVSGDWFMPIPPQTRVRIKHGDVVAVQCDMLIDTKWPHDADGVVLEETDHRLTVLLDGRDKPDSYSKRWVWVMP
jgi:hypothetical protein